MFNSKNMRSFIIFLFAINSCYSDCLIPISSLINILIFKNNEILYPNDGNGQIHFKNGDPVTFACPGRQINNLITDTADFTCNDNMYTYNNVNYPIESVTCSDTISSVEKIIGPCLNGYELLHIGFQFNSGFFLPQIEVCWDNTLKRTIYTQAILEKELGQCSSQANRPNFRSGIYFTPSLANWYTKHGQVFNLCNTFSQIPPQIDVFSNLLEIGHLVAKCDFIYDVQQRLTFQYTNTAPQWKSFNGGNWQLLERQVRMLVAMEQSKLTIYTGTYGTFRFGLKDYYLNNKDSEVPVPLYFWKVIIKEESATSTLGIAIIGKNDIFNYDPNDKPCTDILPQVNWLHLPRANTVRNGYIIACDVNEFVKLVGSKTELPHFPQITGQLLGPTTAG